MPDYPAAAAAHDVEMRRLEVMALGAGRSAWRNVSRTDLSGSWLAAVGRLTPLISALQARAAAAGASYVSDALAEQGDYVLPDGFVDPAAFAGVAADGRLLSGLLYSPVTKVKELIGAGLDVGQAVQVGGRRLDMLLRTSVADAGRAAAGADIAARPQVGYVRMLNPPSCARCAVLAGRWYRWNEGFLRHPRCDCRHIPAKENAAGDLRTDAYGYFKSLAPQEQRRIFTEAGAKAINDGADLFQVVNSRRGMYAAGMKTREGTGVRGSYGKRVRLTPEAIYKLNGSDRAAAVRDLEKYGYILPGGQNPLGSIVGQRDGLNGSKIGYGALGHGGAYGAARQRVEDAIAHGRDPAVRATMTEAERRLFDAKARWELVQQGINPYTAPSMTSRAKPLERPLTPAIAAQVEKDYRRWLATGGQIFAP